MQLIVLRGAVVFEFDGGIGEFGFEPIAIEVAHCGVAEVDIDSCTCLAPCTRYGGWTAMRHEGAAIEEHEIIWRVVGCFILLIPKIADTPGAVTDVNRGFIGCTWFLARGNADEQQEV